MPSSSLLSRKALSSSDPHSSLQLAQEAPAFIQSQPATQPIFPFSLFSKPETPEKWINYEQLLLACLRTGDDKSAEKCLERLTTRFGPANERVMGLRGLFEEATAEDRRALEKILDGYEGVLRENPVNVPIMKRRVTLLRTLSKPVEATTALVEFLEAFPTDGEAWCQLAELYQSQGMTAQAVFSLEEALLIAPNAWNLHALLGEVEYVSTTSQNGGAESLKLLADSVRRFCRSIELCDDYLRGYYGLKLATNRLLTAITSTDAPSAQQLSKGEVDIQSEETLRKLNKLATTKLAEIVKTMSKSGRGNENELIAAQALLDRDEEVNES
ncbi:hypothetical protein FQN54_000649 [Arachnomyces sp. PD_36]|nr:hypothetical protein FQN54_000649 [Arachnomyces sp. PD_36]